MNKYLISLIEILALGAFARYSSKNIFLFTGDQSIVKLNYIFWAIIIVLSVLVNFHLYIYFGSVLLLGIFFLAIYIHKIVKVTTFVDTNYFMFFWMLFFTFFIPIIVILLTKRVLYSAANSEAPQGYVGDVGNTGETGTNFFIESVGDRAYVLIVNGIEEYFREILDKNEIDYDGTEMQFNNMYLKNNIKRICNSKQFIEIIWNQAKTDRELENVCGYFENAPTESTFLQKRYCTVVSGIGRSGNVPTAPSTTTPCRYDTDCNQSNSHNISDENEILTNLLRITRVNTVVSDSTQITDLEENILYYLFIRVKYWIRLILENNCEEDKKLRAKLKIQEIYKLSDVNMGFVDDFREYQESTSLSEDDKDEHLSFNSINHLRMNNLLGRKFLQSDFQNDKYWQNYNIKTINRNPFEIIHEDPFWSYGISPCFTTSAIETNDSCSIPQHP